jgi:hypothetical protein
VDCLDAQAAISEALDGATSDTAALDAAKQHCRDCAECGAFVRSLTLVKRAGLPEPPADLADRVMVTVRREAAADVAAQAAETDTGVVAKVGALEAAGAAATDVASEGSDAPRGNAEESGTVRLSRRLKRTRPTILAAWIGAAALLVAGIGTVGVMGVRLMSQPPTAVSTGRVLGSGASAGNVTGADQAPQAAESAAGSAAKGTTTSAAGDYIVFNGTAYRLVGPSTISRTQTSQLGSTKTSLDGATALTRDVLGAGTDAKVYVANDQGQLLEFERVERTFQGTVYQLKSGEISAFGTWPGLPPDIAKPTSADGSPTFLAVGADSAGVTIYRLATSTLAKGIAVAPGGAESDPAGGNPGWTWWAPGP